MKRIALALICLFALVPSISKAADPAACKCGVGCNCDRPCECVQVSADCASGSCAAPRWSVTLARNTEASCASSSPVMTRFPVVHRVFHPFGRR